MVVVEHEATSGKYRWVKFWGGVKIHSVEVYTPRVSPVVAMEHSWVMNKVEKNVNSSQDVK